jgi:hypothetical protein
MSDATTGQPVAISIWLRHGYNMGMIADRSEFRFWGYDKPEGEWQPVKPEDSAMPRMMDRADARRHAAHMCDVYPWDEAVEHIGVIERLHRGRALVGGHPEYPARWFPYAELTTTCKVED